MEGGLKAGDRISPSDIELDVASMTIAFRQKRLRISLIEMIVLRYLLERPGLGWDEIVDLFNTHDGGISYESLGVRVNSLRKLLAILGLAIERLNRSGKKNGQRGSQKGRYHVVVAQEVRPATTGAEKNGIARHA